LAGDENKLLFRRKKMKEDGLGKNDKKNNKNTKDVFGIGGNVILHPLRVLLREHSLEEMKSAEQ